MALLTETQFLVDFNFHDVASALGLSIPPEAAAQMYGVSLDDLNSYQREVDNVLSGTVLHLSPQLQTADFINLFQTGQKVLCIGDSITTYRYSYAHLLRHLLVSRGVQVVNKGFSGYTSTHGLELTYTQFLALQPNWVFIKYGVNDCKRFGGRNQRTLVSLDEYVSNMRNIVAAFQQHSTATIVLLTPTLVIEELVNTNPDIAAMRLTWDNADLKKCGEAALEVAHEAHVTGIDLRTTLGVPPAVELMCPDGLHPNARGQQRMLEHIIRSISVSPLSAKG